jgi:LDH2 family malate/lactate/ureidoglycolate dehydrogenase
MPILRPEQMRKLCETFIEKLGGSKEEAEAFADMFVKAELRGVRIQGLQSMNPFVIKRIREGHIKLRSKIKIIRETSASILLDGENGLGQIVGKKAMELAIRKAKEAGIGVVSVRKIGDMGMLAYYSMMALQHNCIGVVFCNARPMVAPWGGKEPIIGTNPISVAIPAGKERPIVVDVATIDRSRFSLPFKIPFVYSSVHDYCFGVVIDLMAGALSGTACAKDVYAERGAFCMVIDISQFLPIAEFKRRVDRMITQVKSSQLAEGFTEILMPGEREFKEEEVKLREGIPIPDEIWDEVRVLADELKVDWKKVTESIS